MHTHALLFAWSEPLADSFYPNNATHTPTHTHTTNSELGKITLDKTFEERETLNLAIVASINGAAEAWGLQCLRYEIKDITPPAGVCGRLCGWQE